MSITERWRRYQLKKIRAKKQGTSTYEGYRRLHKVFVFFEFGHPQQEQVYAFIHRLEQEGKQVVVLAYWPQKGKALPAHPKAIQLLGKSALNWYGRPPADIEKSLFGTRYDLYVDLCTASFPARAFVQAWLEAGFTTGIKNTEDYTFNLLIEAGQEGLEAFFKELDYYLHFINKDAS